MLLFLASVIEQMDLALEHISEGDVHNARFGLMLTDNALELVLHQIVKDKREEASGWRYRENPYAYETQLKKAYLGAFPDKLSFARLDGGLDAQTARTFAIMHEYRNDVYHAGLAHEEILPSLARFYFDEACNFLASYNPRGFGWMSGQKLPERAKKYFNGDPYFPGKPSDFPSACQTMAERSGHVPDKLVDALADDVDRLIEYVDTCLQIVTEGVYEGQQTTRDRAIVENQAWDLAFDDVGQAFAKENGFQGSVFELVEFLARKYPFDYRRDPIPGWLAQAAKLRVKADPHMALDHYQSFIRNSGRLRASLERSAAAAEAEIDALIDQRRGR